MTEAEWGTRASCRSALMREQKRERKQRLFGGACCRPQEPWNTTRSRARRAAPSSSPTIN